MTLKLYYHPLSSFCWKAMIALYENDTPFEPVLVNLGDPDSRAAFLAVWPMGQFPVVKDDTRDRLVPESSIIVEYLDDHYPGRTRFIPEDKDKAREVRMRDRFFDQHIHVHMQKITGNRIRPEGKTDPLGVEQARARMAMALGMVEESAGERWAVGDDFTLADVSAAPALFYADRIASLKDKYPKTNAYLERLKARPSFARTLKEAEPFFHMFPQEKKS
jgi:glutathione S-transferase